MIRTNNSDVIWNYFATFLKIGSSALLIPFVLKEFSSEMVGIYIIFVTITSFSQLLDLGFNPSFTRNISYIFSGIQNLKSKGIEKPTFNKNLIDYSLLKGLIDVMKWFYFRVSIILLLLLLFPGTYYILVVTKSYSGNLNEIYISWALLCIINTYNIYSQYYNSLLTGRGLIKISKQIIIIGQIVYLSTGITLVLNGYGLISIILSQGISVFLIRTFSYYVFFTKKIKNELLLVKSHSKDDIFKAIYPNSIKIGLTSLGSFMINKSVIILGSLYLSLEDIASFGITNQLILVMSGLGSIYIGTYIPKISQHRVNGDVINIRKIYLRGILFLILTYLFGSLFLIFFGKITLNLLDSNTNLISNSLLILYLTVSFLEINHSIAGSILVTKNEVPFFKASIVSGFLTILLLLVFLETFNLGLLGIILAPGIVQLFYQNWKWPYEVFKDLKII